MTDHDELQSRREALQQALAAAREQVATRDAARAEALAELEARRAELESEVAALEGELSALEATSDEITEAWTTARRDAAGAKAHLKELGP